MREPDQAPSEIKLHRKSRSLELVYPDGEAFRLPCEYLRVFSPSAEVQGHGPGQGVLLVGKEKANIKEIEPVGNYAVRLIFEDGHNSGIYSWDYLRYLGERQEENWANYLARLEEVGYKRKPVEDE
ncbi:MAG: DUF971 domain-containing protein [Gammaproteobacteria bacterium]